MLVEPTSGRDLAALIQGAIEVKPGDRVLLFVPRDTRTEEAARIKAGLLEYAPDVNWAIVSGVEHVLNCGPAVAAGG